MRSRAPLFWSSVISSCSEFGVTFNRHFQADKTGDLDVVEVFKLEHYVAAARREYVESYESMNPPSVTQTQMKKALSARGNTFYLFIVQKEHKDLSKH